MKSRITIDVDYDNQPIIRVDYQHSEDVRDKLVKRFMESFGSESYFCTFFYDQSVYDQSNRMSIIRPMPVKEFRYHLDAFTEYTKKAIALENGPFPVGSTQQDEPKEQTTE